MASPYVTDLLAQPAALRATLAGLQPGSGTLSAAKTLWRQRSWNRIVLTGMGASYHALMPMAYTLFSAGLPAIVLETSELLHYGLPLLNGDSLVVIVSQSGRSAETLALLERTVGGPARIAVTNTADSPLAQHADVTLLSAAGEEATVSCKTYVATLAVLALLSAQAVAPGDLAEVHEGLLAGADVLENYLAGMEQRAAELGALVGDAGTLVLVGRGASLAAVGTGALIIKEAAKVHAEGLSSAAFRHGPFELAGPGLAALVYGGHAPTAMLNQGLASDIAAAGGRAIFAAAAPPKDAPGVHWLELSAWHAAAMPLVEILPPQMLSLALAQREGREAGVFLHGSKVTTVE